MIPQIEAAARELCEDTRRADTNELWQSNADLMSAYALTGEPQTPESAASTRELTRLLIDGLYDVYGCDLTTEDFDGRQWGCPLRSLIFQAFRMRDLLNEFEGVTWWQQEAKKAAAARAQRDEPISAALDLAA